MDEAIGCLGGLVGVIVCIAAAVCGALLVTSNAILFKEERMTDTPYYTCSYFTGTRTVELISGSSTGCKRFIPVGVD